MSARRLSGIAVIFTFAAATIGSSPARASNPFPIIDYPDSVRLSDAASSNTASGNDMPETFVAKIVDPPMPRERRALRSVPLPIDRPVMASSKEPEVRVQTPKRSLLDAVKSDPYLIRP
jgi:hypothetical protein